jgi:hypothetical protein
MIGTKHQKIQLVLYSLSLVLATAGLIARLWARRMTRTRWQINDYLMILAYVSFSSLRYCVSVVTIDSAECIRPGHSLESRYVFYVQKRTYSLIQDTAVTVGEMGVHQYDIPRHRWKKVIPFNLKVNSDQICQVLMC